MTTLSNFMQGGEELNARRKSAIILAFNAMDVDGNGFIEPEVLLTTYKASKHPDVISKKLTEESALREFLNTFDVGSEIEGKVTRNEFENYYKRLGYLIASDDNFEAMIYGLYGINGRQGQDSVTAMSRLIAQKEAEVEQLASNSRSDRERQQHIEKLKLDSRTVLNKLGRNNISKESSDNNISAPDISSAFSSNNSWSNYADGIAIATAGPSAPSVSAPYPPRTAFPTPIIAVPAGVAHLISKMKARLRTYGRHGFVALQRAIRSMDKGEKKRISMTDFKIAMKKIDIGLSEAEVRMLFDYFNNEHRGSIDTDVFIKIVRSALNDRRLILVKQAFAKLDIGGDGAIDAGKVAAQFDAAFAPDVISGRSSAEEARIEFLETFDVGGEIEGMVTLSEFINYYTNISACVDNDDYFEMMIRTAWHLGGDRQDSSKRVLVTRKDGSQYIEEVEDHSAGDVTQNLKVQGPPVPGVHTQTFNVFKQTNDFSDHSKPYKHSKTRPLIEVSMEKIEIANDQPSSGSTMLRHPISDSSDVPRGPDEAIAMQGPSFSPRPSRAPPSSTQRVPDYGIKYIIVKLKGEVRSFGLLGFIGLQRRFRAIDRDNTKFLSLADFKKAMRQMNMTLTDGELRMLFEFYDEDNCGLIDYELFVQGVRDPLTGLRLALVKQAFNQLDKDGSGLLDATEVASLYDASRHPDVIRGSTSPQQVLSSFLETFDVGCVVQGKVSFQEFLNYYSNISESVENDDYFELVVRNVWHVDGHRDTSSSAAGRRTLKTKPDGTQYVEEMKEGRTNGLVDITELTQRAAIVAKLQGRVPSGSSDAGSRISTECVHKVSQTNKRRTYAQHSTVGLLVDTTVKHRPMDRGHAQLNAGEQVVLDRVKVDIAERGASSLIGLQRAFRSADTDSDQLLSLSEFKQALSDMSISLSSPETRLLFDHFDTSASGLIDYELFLSAVRNPLSDWRLSLVKRAFAGLDRNKDGAVEASHCALCYNASNHPEVIVGRITSARALQDFLGTFDVVDGMITERSLIDYYSSIGSSIESDQYFELLVRNSWNFKEHSSEEKEVSVPVRNVRNGKNKEPSSIPIAAGIKLGVTVGMNHSAQLGWLGNDSSSQFEGYGDRIKQTMRVPNSGENMIISNLRCELGQRSPVSGYIALQRTFRAMDDGTKLIPLPDFVRVVKELQLGLTAAECRVIFDLFDVNHRGLMDCNTFIDGIRPRLSQNRMQLVDTAFKCLDKDGSGAIEASQIIAAYDPTGHPDVFLGIKTPDAVMRDLVTTFDVGGTVLGKVTKKEFMDYYANIGATVNNEDYFELMLIHAWRPPRAHPQEVETQEEEYQNDDDNHDEPERNSRNAVTFESTLSNETDQSQSLSPHTSTNTYINSNTRRDSNQRPSQSASMQNWIGANVDPEAPSPSATAIKHDAPGGGPRHFNHRKSQIHFP